MCYVTLQSLLPPCRAWPSTISNSFLLIRSARLSFGFISLSICLHRKRSAVLFILHVFRFGLSDNKWRFRVKICNKHHQQFHYILEYVSCDDKSSPKNRRKKLISKQLRIISTENGAHVDFRYQIYNRLCLAHIPHKYRWRKWTIHRLLYYYIHVFRSLSIRHVLFNRRFALIPETHANARLCCSTIQQELSNAMKIWYVRWHPSFDSASCNWWLRRMHSAQHDDWNNMKLVPLTQCHIRASERNSATYKWNNVKKKWDS